MTIEARNEILNKIDKALQEAWMSNKKLSPELKEKIDCTVRYFKYVDASISQQRTLGLQTICTLVQVAGLYTPANREEIGRRIIPSMTKVINTQFVAYDDIQKLMEGMKTKETKIQNLELENQNLESKNTHLTNRLEDIQDEVNLKEKPKLEEAARKEYNLKRDY